MTTAMIECRLNNDGGEQGRTSSRPGLQQPTRILRSISTAPMRRTSQPMSLHSSTRSISIQRPKPSGSSKPSSFSFRSSMRMLQHQNASQAIPESVTWWRAQSSKVAYDSRAANKSPVKRAPLNETKEPHTLQSGINDMDAGGSISTHDSSMQSNTSEVSSHPGIGNGQLADPAIRTDTPSSDVGFDSSRASEHSDDDSSIVSVDSSLDHSDGVHESFVVVPLPPRMKQWLDQTRRLNASLRNRHMDGEGSGEEIAAQTRLPEPVIGSPEFHIRSLDSFEEPPKAVSRQVAFAVESKSDLSDDTNEPADDIHIPIGEESISAAGGNSKRPLQGILKLPSASQAPISSSQSEMI